LNKNRNHYQNYALCVKKYATISLSLLLLDLRETQAIMKPRDPIWNFYHIFEDSNKTTTKYKDCMSAVVSANIIKERNALTYQTNTLRRGPR
jgi:hypothetical protein